MTIVVCPLSQVSDLVRERRPSRVISALDPDIDFPELGPTYIDRHLRLSFHDSTTLSPGVTLPSITHIEELLRFLDTWDGIEPLLVHCRAGIGRSTATAFVAACHRNPTVPELQIATELRRVAPLARPNPKVVSIADNIMRRNGRMIDAIAETGRGLPWVAVHEGVPFELPSHFDLATAPDGAPIN